MMKMIMSKFYVAASVVLAVSAVGFATINKTLVGAQKLPKELQK